MVLNLNDATDILSRTPIVLNTMLRGLPEEWVRANEGPDTFSPFDVIGHLIQGEKKDWIPRARMILEAGELQTFEPFDRFAQLRESADRTLSDLLNEFAILREENIAALRGLSVGPGDFGRRGRHPSFGPVTLSELLATWVVHDLNHIAQVSRVLAGNYAHEVGPWAEYLPILNRRLGKS